MPFFLVWTPNSPNESPSPNSPKPSAECKPAAPNKANKRPRANQKDPIRRGDPASERYFQIRRACANDDATALQSLLPTKVADGQDFSVWPRQHLLLHGLAKSGCVKCVKYLVETLGFDVNHARPKDKCTPLHMAHYNLADKALSAMHDVLLDLNAKQTLKNKYGELASDLVAKSVAVASDLIAKSVAVVVSPNQSPCGVADLHLGAPQLPHLALGPSASPRCSGKTKARSAAQQLAPLPATAALAEAFVPSFASKAIEPLAQAYATRDPRSCAWQPPVDAAAASKRKEGTPSGDLYQAVRRTAVLAMAQQFLA
jgi:hypothetical protein